MVPTAIRQPESHRGLAAKDKLVRKRYQKLGDLSKIISTVTNKVTNLANWWMGLTLLFTSWWLEKRQEINQIIFLLTKSFFSLHYFYQPWLHIHAISSTFLLDYLTESKSCHCITML